jgi:hypothetical protein
MMWIGKITLSKDFGYTMAESEGRVVVVHDATGGRIGCAVLKAISQKAHGVMASLTLLFALALKLYF